MKKIGLICLCLASLGLVGCFHVPDEDWLPSRNKVNTGDTQEDKEMEQAINSFIDGIDMISSAWDEMNNNEVDELKDEELEEAPVDIESENVSDNEEAINNEKIIDNEIGSEEINENFTSED